MNIFRFSYWLTAIHGIEFNKNHIEKSYRYDEFRGHIQQPFRFKDYSNFLRNRSGIPSNTELSDLNKELLSNHLVVEKTIGDDLRVLVPSRESILKGLDILCRGLEKYDVWAFEHHSQQLETIEASRFNFNNRLDELIIQILKHVSSKVLNRGISTFSKSKSAEGLLAISHSIHSGKPIRFYEEILNEIDIIGLTYSIVLLDREPTLPELRNWIKYRDTLPTIALVYHLFPTIEKVNEVKVRFHQDTGQAVTNKYRSRVPLKWIEKSGSKADFAELVQVLHCMKCLYNESEGKLAARKDIQLALQDLFNIEVKDFRSTLFNRYNTYKGPRAFNENVKSNYIDYLNKLLDDNRGNQTD